jgi:hypothetical protein
MLRLQYAKGKCLGVGIYQYFPILDDLYQEIQWGEDTW